MGKKTYVDMGKAILQYKAEPHPTWTPLGEIQQHMADAMAVKVDKALCDAFGVPQELIASPEPPPSSLTKEDLDALHLSMGHVHVSYGVPMDKVLMIANDPDAAGGGILSLAQIEDLPVTYGPKKTTHPWAKPW